MRADRYSRIASALGLSLLLLAQAAPAAAHTQVEKAFYLQSRIVLRLNPRDAAAGNAVGTWNLEYGRLKEAGQAFAGVLRHHREDFLAAAGLALIEEALGRHGPALRRLEAIGTHPPAFSPFLQLVRGRLLTEAGRLAEAERVLAAALENKANPHDTLLWLGIVAERSGRPDAAADYYRRAIEADPYWPQAYARLSLIYQSQGRSAAAKKVLEGALYLDNSSPYPNNDVMVLWGWVMRRETG